MKQGYVALHRKIQEHPFYKEKREFSKYEAWVDILMEVQHSLEPKDVVIGMNVLQCHYGESLKSVKTWSKRWNWTESKVRRYFDLLKKMNQIRTKSEVKTTRLFVINYESYDPKRRANDEQTTSKRSAADEQSTTDNNVKNVKNVNKFIKPTVQEISDYCSERNNGIDPETFFNHYESIGWMRGKNKIKSWKSCIITWEKNNNKNKSQSSEESWRKAL